MTIKVELPLTQRELVNKIAKTLASEWRYPDDIMFLYEAENEPRATALLYQAESIYALFVGNLPDYHDDNNEPSHEEF